MTRANRTAKGSICRISAFFAEIKAASAARSLDEKTKSLPLPISAKEDLFFVQVLDGSFLVHPNE